MCVKKASPVSTIGVAGGGGGGAISTFSLAIAHLFVLLYRNILKEVTFLDWLQSGFASVAGWIIATQNIRWNL